MLNHKELHVLASSVIVVTMCITCFTINSAFSSNSVFMVYYDNQNKKGLFP
jgi:hypothetical protein